MKDQAWFEMESIRQRSMQNVVWVPLRKICKVNSGTKHGYPGYWEEYDGVSSLAIKTSDRKKVSELELDWTHIGLGWTHEPQCYRKKYIPSDVYSRNADVQIGQALVLDQFFDGAEPSIWHLHQDLVIALGLIREGNAWKAINEAYTDAARLEFNPDGSPSLLEIRSDFLRDYLYARSMFLHMVSFHERIEVTEDTSHIKWSSNPLIISNEHFHWEGIQTKIHEGGASLGSTMRVMKISRNDADFESDFFEGSAPSNDNIVLKSYTIPHKGRALNRVSSRLYCVDALEPAQNSPRVRGDKVRVTLTYIVHPSGSVKPAYNLVGSYNWLWFKPDVIPILMRSRGGYLDWITIDLGRVACSKNNGVEFGINRLGLINVFAKDIALLPEWQQRIWHGFNTSPDAGISHELLEAQWEADLARTVAPEHLITPALDKLDKAFLAKYGTVICREHEQLDTIIRNCHRFRSLDTNGLLSLAKDLSRITIENFDVSLLIRLSGCSDKLASLKALEALIAKSSTHEMAYSILTPLHGIYKLRLADAHLPSKELNDSMVNAGVNSSSPPVFQGQQILTTLVNTLTALADFFQ